MLTYSTFLSFGSDLENAISDILKLCHSIGHTRKPIPRHSTLHRSIHTSQDIEVSNFRGFTHPQFWKVCNLKKNLKSTKDVWTVWLSKTVFRIRNTIYNPRKKDSTMHYQLPPKLGKGQIFGVNSSSDKYSINLTSNFCKIFENLCTLSWEREN